MTGVSLGVWRASVGLFHRKRISKNISRGSKDYDGLLIVDHLRIMFYLLDKHFEILFNLLLLFSYCTMVVTLFSIFITVLLCLDIFNFAFFTNQSHPPHYNIFLYPVQSFLSINMIPKIVAYTIK